MMLRTLLTLLLPALVLSILVLSCALILVLQFRLLWLSRPQAPKGIPLRTIAATRARYPLRIIAATSAFNTPAWINLNYFD
jgi:hypothetical protein